MDRLSDGRRVRVASDDPAAAQASIGLRARLAGIEGFDRSARASRSDLALVDNVLGEVVNILSASRAEGMAGATGIAGGNSERARRIEDLRDQLLRVANSSQNGRYVFGGTLTLTIPFDTAGSYSGDDAEVEAPIDSDETVGATLSGRRVFLTGGDLFARLADLATALRNNDTPAMEAAVAALGSDLDRIHEIQTEVGLRMSAIDSALSRHEDETLRIRTRLGEIEDADLAAVAAELGAAQTSQDALYATSVRVLGRSLFDYFG